MDEPVTEIIVKKDVVTNQGWLVLAEGYSLISSHSDKESARDSAKEKAENMVKSNGMPIEITVYADDGFEDSTFRVSANDF